MSQNLRRDEPVDLIVFGQQDPQVRKRHLGRGEYRRGGNNPFEFFVGGE
jgi:hypothetical protein